VIGFDLMNLQKQWHAIGFAVGLRVFIACAVN
jgi:hypothetical protein